MNCRLLVVLVLLAVDITRGMAAVPRPAKTAAAPGGVVDISADTESFDAATGDSVLTGHARLTNGDLLLTADEIRYNTNTDIATAVGHIAFTRGEVRLLADRLVYRRRDDSFTADNIRLGSHPYFIEGFSASGTRSEITVMRARASYGEPGPWQPTINADKIIFSPGQALRSENVTIGIGHAQPVPIPRFDHRLGAPLVGAVNLTGGYRRSLGAFADGTVHVPISPSLRLGADAGIFTSRGVMIGPSGRYGDPEMPDELRGHFRSGYINDHGDKQTDILGRPIREDRAFAEWQHQQTLAPNLSLNAQLNWWKDSDVLRDFRPRAFFPVQEPDTFVESVYTGANYFVSAFARFQPNSFHRVQERLPEVRFDLLPLAMGLGIYERFSASAAVLREDSVADGTAPPVTFPLVTGGRVITPDARTLIEGGPERRSLRFDAYYALERPFAPTEWFSFTPIAGARLTHYAQPKESGLTSQSVPAPFPQLGYNIYGARLNSLGAYTRTLGEVGFDAALRGSGIFEYKNPQWKIDGLRHLITPRVSYRYIPEAEKGREHIPAIDRDVFSTYLQPLGLGDGRNVDTLHSANTVRLGLDNLLQTRDSQHGSRDLLVLNLASDVRLRRLPIERKVSDVYAELAAMPTSWLQVDLFQSFAPQSFAYREINTGVTLRDGRWWSVRFGNNYLRNRPRDTLRDFTVHTPLQDYSLDARARINERFDALTRLRYDARRHRFNEQAYGVVQNLGNTWLISYTVSLYSGRRRESSFGFNVQIDTVRF